MGIKAMFKDRYAGSNTKGGSLGTFFGFAVAAAIALPLGLNSEEPLFWVMVGAFSIAGTFIASFLTPNDNREALAEAQKARTDLLNTFMLSRANDAGHEHEKRPETFEEDVSPVEAEEVYLPAHAAPVESDSAGSIPENHEGGEYQGLASLTK